MKKNDMLNESTIRRFMKLATIDGLSDKFVDERLQESEEQELEERSKSKRDEKEMREGEEDLEEMRSKAKKDDEVKEGVHEDDDEKVKEGKDKEEDEIKEASDEELEEELTFEEEDLEERSDSMSFDRDDDDAEAGGAMVSVDQLMSALERALEDVLGQEVEVSQDDEELDMDPLSMDAPEEEGDLGLDAVEDEEDDLEEGLPNPDVVEEVFARVIQRLTQETKSNKK